MLALIWLQIMLKDSVYSSRYWVLQRGVDEFLTLILIIAGPALTLFPIAEFSRDRAWVMLAPRVHLRSFVRRLVGVVFINGFAVFATAMLATMVGAYLISFQPGINWSPWSGPPSGTTDLSLAAEQSQILNSGAGLITPVAGVSMFLFYPVWLLWVAVWGGVLAVFVLVFELVLPWPRIGLLVAGAWWYASLSMFGYVDFGIGAVSINLAMFPTKSSLQPWFTPILATVLYLLPAVIVGVWGWRRLERLPGFS